MFLVQGRRGRYQLTKICLDKILIDLNFFQTLGILLVWKSPSDGVKVQLDLSITLLNRENFAENRNFKISAAEFEARAQCYKTFYVRNLRIFVIS
jgi:hypothetical protein